MEGSGGGVSPLGGSFNWLGWKGLIGGRRVSLTIEAGREGEVEAEAYVRLGTVPLCAMLVGAR